MNALALAISALQSLLQLVPLTVQLRAQYDAIVASLTAMHDENRDPTDAEWATVRAAREALEAQLNAP